MNSSETGPEATRGSNLLMLLPAILLVALLLLLTHDKPQQGASDPANTGSSGGSLDDSSIPPRSLDPIATPAAAEAAHAFTNSVRQTVHGQQVPYSLQLPPNWTTQSIAMDGVDNLSASCGAANLAIMVQAAKICTPQEAAAAATALLKASATDFQSTKTEPIILDGKRWLKFAVKCRISRVPMGYQYYVYSGAEGTYQIVAWTEQQNFDREIPLLHRVVQTFRFPQT